MFKNWNICLLFNFETSIVTLLRTNSQITQEQKVNTQTIKYIGRLIIKIKYAKSNIERITPAWANNLSKSFFIIVLIWIPFRFYFGNVGIPTVLHVLLY